MTPSFQPLGQHRSRKTRRKQGGIVLIIAMILLIVISMLAVTSLRNSGSNEVVAANVRTTELATQAADIALRHCENSVIELVTTNAGRTSTGYSTAITNANLLTATTPANWTVTSNWDGSSSTLAYILPTSLVGTSTYKRPPECMIEHLAIMPAGSGVVNNTASYVITARGFGPEVASDPNHGRPSGSEVWLQSQIELQ